MGRATNKKRLLGKIGFKKGCKPHNSGVTYAKESNLTASECKNVKLEEKCYNLVSNKLLPDNRDVKTVSAKTEFRCLRPKKSLGALVDCLAETETDAR